MALRDQIQNERADAERARAAAATGASQTGFGNRHMDMGDPNAIFGRQVGPDPVMGERLPQMQVQRLGEPDKLDAAIAADPILRERRLMPANREPFGATEQQLAWPVRPNFRRYWFADNPGRVARAKRAGYTHVIDPDTGQPLSRVTDRVEGRGRSSYLMEIPIEWYQADMSRQAAELARRLDDIRTGTAGPGADDNRYVPQQGISMSR